MRCLFRGHRWRWYGLYDHDIRKPSLTVSQCDRCKKVVGGWRGRSDLLEDAEFTLCAATIQEKKP